MFPLSITLLHYASLCCTMQSVSQFHTHPYECLRKCKVIPCYLGNYNNSLFPFYIVLSHTWSVNLFQIKNISMATAMVLIFSVHTLNFGTLYCQAAIKLVLTSFEVLHPTCAHLFHIQNGQAMWPIISLMLKDMYCKWKCCLYPLPANLSSSGMGT